MASANPTWEQIPLVRRAWARVMARLLPAGTPDGTAAAEEVEGASSRFFESFVYTRYTEPQRHYHTLVHLEEMLAQLLTYETQHGWHSAYRPALASPAEAADRALPSRAPSDERGRLAHEWTGTVLLLSVLFHDVIYDPTRGDNEEASAVLAEEFLRAAQDEDARLRAAGTALPADASSRQHNSAESSAASASAPATVLPHPSTSASAPSLWDDAAASSFVRDSTATYILKTKEHLSVPPAQQLSLPTGDGAEVDGDVRASRDDPLHVFLDLDLAILGHPSADTYRHRYSENIAREYSHYARPDYLKGRSGFLRGFMARPQWYKTPFFFYRLKAQARRNTAEEVTELDAELQALTEGTA